MARDHLVMRVVSQIECDCRECAFWTPGKLGRPKLMKNLTTRSSQSHWVGRLHREGGTCQITGHKTCVTCSCEDFAALSAHEKAERIVAHGA